MRHFLLLRHFAVMACLATTFAANAADGSGPCQLQASQDERKWPFDVEYIYEKPFWSAEKSAEALMLMQAQYLSNKTSPFMKNSIPSELAFYEAHVTFKIKPYLTYTQTLDGRSCAQVVGAKLVVQHSPEILLARELAARNCVSRAALNHQLKHDQAAIEQAKALVEAKGEAKKMIFPVYEKQGAAGRTQQDILNQLALMEKTATGELAKQFQQNLRLNRRQKVVTRENFSELYGACKGEFEKASGLARGGQSHE